MSESIPPTRQSLTEALALSSEILRNLEMSELPLSNIALKASRLARLLNDFEAQRMFEYEVVGYPSTSSGVPTDLWHVAVTAGREFTHTELITNVEKQLIFLESISALEEKLRTAESSLAASRDPAVPQPAPPPPFGGKSLLPAGNWAERSATRQDIQLAANRLASRRNLIYQYVLRKYYELKFSGIADDVFARVRERVDSCIGFAIPDSVKRLSAIYDNLRSENPEDWSNAVHGCRRVLQDLADALFPETTEDRIVQDDGKSIHIRLGKEYYINRIITFVQDSADSGRFKDIVGSHLRFLGDRLNSIVEAANKGSHDTIVSREEADRYVIYTYLLIGDILTLVV